MAKKIKNKIHKASNSDYRVEEYGGYFKIQKKKVEKKTIGFLWWRKTIIETKWLYIDNKGRFLVSLSYGSRYINNYSDEIKPFTDLQSAFNKISIIENGPKYHYLDEYED